jgi:outer membrane protein assembly factor BamD
MLLSRLPVWALPTIVLAGLSATACASRSRYDGMTAEAMHVYAQTEFDEGDFSNAVEAADRLLLTFPEYQQAADVRFLLGRAYFEDERYLLASDEFQRFLQRHSGHLMAAEAAIGICRSEVALSPIPARDPSPTRRAETACRDVATQYRAHAVYQEADSLARVMREKLAEKEYLVGHQYFRRGAYDSAIWQWTQVVDQFGDTPWAPRALLGMSCASEEIGYDDEATEYRLQLLNAYPDSDPAREARSNGQGC